MLLDFLQMKQQENFLSFLFKAKGNGNHIFSEGCITEEFNKSIYTMPIQYNLSVSLDRFMVNADIKLFLMVPGYSTFVDLNDKELCACFEYAGTLGYKVLV